MKMRLTIVIDYDATSYREIAAVEDHFQSILDGMKDKYPDTLLVTSERREREVKSKDHEIKAARRVIRRVGKKEKVEESG